jgi:hypothetical protein
MELHAYCDFTYEGCLLALFHCTVSLAPYTDINRTNASLLKELELLRMRIHFELVHLTVNHN